MTNSSSNSISDQKLQNSNDSEVPDFAKQATNYAISTLGGYAQTAKHFGLTRSAVHQWAERGVPANRVMTLCRLVEHKVKPEQIRPDVFQTERPQYPY